jgi:hypothetical protein
MRLFRKSLFRNNTTGSEKLWSSKDEFDERWKERIATMSSYISIPGTVADFGCGLMWLEHMLGPNNTYLPIDYISRDNRTQVIDFNAAPLPRINAEIAFLSGSLEYVVDVKGFVEYLIETGFKQVIVSYCTIELIPQRRTRQQLNWVSHESVFTLLSLFCPPYSLTNLDRTHGANTIFVFKR